MGLSAFNRARELRAQRNEQSDKEKHAQRMTQRQADEAAAASVYEMIAGIDPKSLDFMRTVLKSRIAYNELTLEQKAWVGNCAELEEAEAILIGKLEIPTSPVEIVPPADSTPAPPPVKLEQSEGDNVAPIPPVETLPPAAKPQKKPKRTSGTKGDNNHAG